MKNNDYIIRLKRRESLAVVQYVLREILIFIQSAALPMQASLVFAIMVLARTMTLRSFCASSL